MGLSSRPSCCDILFNKLYEIHCIVWINCRWTKPTTNYAQLCSQVFTLVIIIQSCSSIKQVVFATLFTTLLLTHTFSSFSFNNAHTHTHTHTHIRSALIKCLKAVTPSPPTAHTMYWFWLVGSMLLSQVVSAAESTHHVTNMVVMFSLFPVSTLLNKAVMY